MVLIAARRRRRPYPLLQAAKAARDASEAAARKLGQQSSEIGDDRPVGGCAFSPDGKLLAACGWGGMANLWLATDSANVARVRGFRAHPERATGICWHPQATLSQVGASVARWAPARSMWGLGGEGGAVAYANGPRRAAGRNQGRLGSVDARPTTTKARLTRRLRTTPPACARSRPQRPTCSPAAPTAPRRCLTLRGGSCASSRGTPTAWAASRGTPWAGTW